ncbi:MAG: alkylation repair protein [Microbacteriaceae bacterium]|nr:alkylation repair protein [Microbacteriaceae bacterium]
MSEAGEFIDATLQLYGSSVGAVRGTMKDAARRFPALSHDAITALASELWRVPSYERRLSAIVLLQSNLELLIVSDLTRIEGFVRTADGDELIEPLLELVVVPLSIRFRNTRADVVFERWTTDPQDAVRLAGDAAAPSRRSG